MIFEPQNLEFESHPHIILLRIILIYRSPYGRARVA
jgi:hypothetical protein